MRFTRDEGKNRANKARHGLDLRLAEQDFLSHSWFKPTCGRIMAKIDGRL